MKIVDTCVECGNDSFIDLPEGSATYRWGPSYEHPHCMCDAVDNILKCTTDGTFVGSVYVEGWEV